MMLFTFGDRLSCVQLLLQLRCSSALEIVGALEPYLGSGVYAGASPRAPLRGVRGSFISFGNDHRRGRSRTSSGRP